MSRPRFPNGATLVVASSLPVRALEWCMAPRDNLRVLANRGANGIDGFVSTVVGVAQASAPAPTVGLCGDLCFLHDTNGLLGATGPATFVVLDNDGGGIFSYLPPAELPGVRAAVRHAARSRSRGGRARTARSRSGSTTSASSPTRSAPTR